MKSQVKIPLDVKYQQVIGIFYLSLIIGGLLYLLLATKGF